MTSDRTQPHPGLTTLDVGFVPLIDAAPVIATLELGYFADEGLAVRLHRELGWANIRDKLAFGRMHAAHALLGLAVRSAMQGAAVRSVMALGGGGDAITLSAALLRAGVDSAVTLGRYVRQAGRQPPLTFAHVFDSSVHHYLLRDWLDSGDIDPDTGVKLCVLPPAQLPAHLAAGQIDGYCVGEPWNTLADEQGDGRIVALTTDLVPTHPDKVLAVNGRWADAHPKAMVALIRAVVRGCAYCADPRNVDALAAVLARPHYLGAAASTIAASLRLDRTFDTPRTVSHLRARDWRMRSFDATFPSHTHAAWLVTHMRRWAHVEPDVDPWAVAAKAIDTAPYRVAAADLNLACPPTDTPPMPLRNRQAFGPRLTPERTTA